MLDLAIVILAAGKGERMRSERPKVMHLLGGRPLLSYSLQNAQTFRPKKTVVVVGRKADDIRRAFADRGIQWTLQRQPLGTAHAVLSAAKSLKGFHGWLLILYGDVPLLKRETLQQMIQRAKTEEASMVILTTHLGEPTGYGRVIRDERGQVQRIVEEKEASDWEKQITEINSGISLVKFDDIQKPLQRVKKSIVKGEYYLTDIIAEFVLDGKKVVSHVVPEFEEVMGVNSQKELAQADQVLQKRIRDAWMEKGVTMLHPDSVRIESDVKIEPGVVLHPGVILMGKTKIAKGAEIFAYSVVEASVIGEEARIGPFAHLRPGSVVGAEAHVGNFVELKKTKLGPGAKANHLAYLGDAVVGAKSNIGAGTITCNYDGTSKHQTIIGDRVFVGSDTQFVAPVRIGREAFIGAGTTVTEDVPAKALAVSRVEQTNVLNWKKKKKK